MNRSIILLAWFMILLVLTGCTKEQNVPIYQLIPVSTRDIVFSANAAGAVEPIRTIDVKSKASGEIVAVLVETGDEVQPGELLVKVDPRVPRNALRQAEADLEVAKAQLDNSESQLKRAEVLYNTEAVTEQEYENAILQAANAKAALVRSERSLEDAKISFEDTEVRAALPGMIIQKNIEVGTVISSATREVGGGSILLQMANLDTVQIRALVDETDIGKIGPGMSVTITVAAYPNRPFQGEVLKIEPLATVQQNVTMFPVLARIENREGLLKPGMNAEVEIHVGERRGVLAIPNGALRTERNVGSATMVLGLDPEAVQQQISEARQASSEKGDQTLLAGGGSASGQKHGETINMRGRDIELPDGVTTEQARQVFSKMRNGGGPQGLNAEDQAVWQRMRTVMGGGRRGGGQRRAGGADNALFGGNYIVFAMRSGEPTPIPIRTGLTDLDYSEVVSGLSESDTVLILPSSSLIASQQRWQDRMSRMKSRSMPGMKKK